MSAHPPDSLNPAAFISFALVLILIWGSAYTMVSVGVDYISPIWLVVYRLIIGAAFVTLYVKYKGYKFPALSDRRWLWYFIMGLTGAVVPFFLLSTGQETVDSGITAILVGIMPLMTIVLAHFFTDERLNFQKGLGFFIGFLGIIVLFLPDNFSLKLVADWKAQSLIVTAAFLYAVTTVIAKRAPETPSSVGAAMMLICAALVAIIGGLITGPPTSLPAMTGIWMAIGLGIGSTGLATILYLYIIEQTGPSVIAKINYFVPVASVIFGVGLLGEAFSWRMVISFAVIVLGVMVSRIGAKPIAASNP
jgi:drug/metabolite transporter (DMT)-like permease